MANLSFVCATRGPLLIATAAALWGTTGIAAKFLFASSALPSLTLAFLRLAIAAPVFLLLWVAFEAMPFKAKPSKPLPSKKAPVRTAGIWGLLLLGLTQAGYQASYLGAVDLAGAGLATLVALCLAPVFVAVIAIPLWGEPFNRLILTGLIGAIAGTGLLVMGGEAMEVDRKRLLGVAIATGAAILYAGFTLVSRQTARGQGPYQTACVCFGAGALILLPIVILKNGLASLAELTTVEVGLLIYIAVVPTCLGYVCFFKGMRSTTATSSSIIMTLEPLFAALLAWVLLGERLGPLGLIGALVLVAAVTAASRGTQTLQSNPATRAMNDRS